MEGAKKITAKNKATRKVHIQLKGYEAFYMCINYMNSLSLFTTNEDRFIQIIQQSSNTIKDTFVQIGGKLAELPHQRRDTVARYIIQIMK